MDIYVFTTVFYFFGYYTGKILRGIGNTEIDIMIVSILIGIILIENKIIIL